MKRWLPLVLGLLIGLALACMALPTGPSGPCGGGGGGPEPRPVPAAPDTVSQ